MLPQGHRLHVVLEVIRREFAIRKFVLKAARLSDLVRLGSMPPQVRGSSRLRSWSARTSLWLDPRGEARYSLDTPIGCTLMPRCGR